MKQAFYTFVFVVLLYNCTKQKSEFNGQFVGSFPDPVELQGMPILEQERGILYVNFIDSLLVCVTNRDTLLHVYDKGLNHLASFGQKGRGPGEFAMPPVIEDVMVEETVTKALIRDGIRMELRSINMTASIEQEEIVLENITKIPRSLFGLFNAFYLIDDTYVGVYDDRFSRRLDERRGGFYYHAGLDSLETFPLFNLRIEPYEGRPETNLNARAPTLSPDRRKLAIVMIRSPMLEIFDIGSRISKRFTLDPNPPGEIFDLADYYTGELIQYYENIYVTDKYIYLLYSGSKETEVGNDQRIQVLDWDGNPRFQYLIQAEYDLTKFVVDEEDGKIYGSSYPNDAVYLFDFSMKENHLTYIED